MKKVIFVLTVLSAIFFAGNAFATTFDNSWPTNCIYGSYSYTGLLVSEAGWPANTAWPHTMIVTQCDPFTGQFFGHGYFNLNPGYTWNLSGRIIGSRIFFDIVYTGWNLGYTGHMQGTINNGTMSGTGVATGGQFFVWNAYKNGW
jgi:hypothetical protein